MIYMSAYNCLYLNKYLMYVWEMLIGWTADHRVLFSISYSGGCRGKFFLKVAKGADLTVCFMALEKSEGHSLCKLQLSSYLLRLQPIALEPLKFFCVILLQSLIGHSHVRSYDLEFSLPKDKLLHHHQLMVSLSKEFLVPWPSIRSYIFC